MRKVAMLMTLLFAMCVSGSGGPTKSAKEQGRFIYEYPGYTDTPLIAGSEFIVHQKDRPQPPVVLSCPSETMPPVPSDAAILFDGTSVDNFQQTSWQVKDGALIAGRGYLKTKKAYGDCQLHIEWRTPNPPSGKPSNMGNSGVFMMGLYELQIYDSFSSKIYADGSAGAIYGQSPPMVNVCREPGQWQSFDIIFKAPVFKDGRLVRKAIITVFHNGVLIHYNTKILGPTVNKTTRPYKFHAAKLPLKIQGHGSPVAFRNIWLRPLNDIQK